MAFTCCGWFVGFQAALSNTVWVSHVRIISYIGAVLKVPYKTAYFLGTVVNSPKYIYII